MRSHPSYPRRGISLPQSIRGFSFLALVPLHELINRILAFVEPLQTKRLFAEDRCFETSPGLNFKVVKRAAVRTQTMRDSRRKVNECSRFDLLEFVVHLDQPTAFES